MSPINFNEEKDTWEYVENEVPSSTSTAVATPPSDSSYKAPTDYLGLLEQRQQQRYQAEDARIQQELDDAAAGVDDRPMFAENPGMFASDLGKIAVNAGFGLVTDYVDLGLGVADVIGQTGKALTGQGFDVNEIFNDADNPLTKWRRTALKTETQAGQTASNFVRLGLAIVSLPKIAVKGAALLPKAIGNIKGLSKLKAVGTKLDKLDDAMNVSRNPKVANKLKNLDLATDAGKKAANRAVKNDWLTFTYADIAKNAEAANWWKGVSNSAAALTSIKKVKGTKAKIRTVAEAVGWDAFVAFNVFGEGQDDFDETLTDFLAESGLPNIGYFQTDVTDSAIEIKWKQMLEGLITAAPMSAVVDMIRIRKFAKAFSAAGDADKAKIIAAFNDEADQLGRGLGNFIDQQTSQAGKGFSQVAKGTAGSAGPMRPGWDPSMDPWSGGALARLSQEVNFANQLDNRVTEIEGAGLGARSQGLIGESPQAVDAQIAATRGSQAPIPEFGDGQPIPEGRVRFPGSGLQGESPQAVNAQIAATRAGQAPVPEFGNGQVIGEQPIRPDPGRGPLGPSSPVPGRPAPIPEWEKTGPASPIPGNPAPMPEWGMGVTPRNPDPSFDTATIKKAFDEDAASVFADAVVLGQDDLTPKQLKVIASQIEQLAPKTRVDAIDYVKKNPIKTNELGVIEASQSVTANFIVNRGLLEGWATVGDDMQIRFTRNPAASLDRGDLAEESAKIIDESIDVELYDDAIKASDPDSAKAVDVETEQLVETSPATPAPYTEADLQAAARDLSRLSPGQLQGRAESLQEWVNAGRPSDEAVLDSKQAALDVIQQKGQVVNLDKVPGVEINEALNDRAMGKSTPATEGVRRAYMDFYGLKDKPAAAVAPANPKPLTLENQAEKTLQSKAVTAKTKEERFDLGEQVRLSPSEELAITGGTADEQVAREMLGVDLNSVKGPDIQKAENGRKWAVVDENGEELETFTRKSQAEKAAKRQLDLAKDDLVKKARQLEADGSEQLLEIQPGKPVLDSGLTADVKLTKAQLEALGELTGEQINKSTFRFTQAQMSEAITKTKELIDSGLLSGNKLRVARNLVDKLDTQVKLLSPAARAIKQAQDLAVDAGRFLKNGEFC